MGVAEEGRATLRPLTAAAAACLCLLLGVPHAAAATIALPDDAGASPGLSAIVYIAIDDAGGMLGTDLILAYDPAVAAATGVTTTSLSVSQNLTYNLAPEGTIRISLYGSNPLGGSGDLLAVSFTATGPPGSRTVLDLVSADLNEGGIPAALVDGRFCVEGPGEEVGGVSVTHQPGSTTARLSWTGHPYAEAYNLYRATRPDLGDLDCLAAAVAGTEASDDGLAPPVGGLFVVLVTGRLCGGETSAGVDSSGAERILPALCP